MSRILGESVRYLIAASIVCLVAGCATDGGSRVARSAADCPPGFLLSCEGDRRGARTALSKCGCERHADINAMLQGEL